MAKISGNQVNIGLGIEATAGTGVAATVYPKWNGDLSLQAVSEKALFNSARGVRNMASDSMIRRKYSEGSVGVVPNVAVAPYFFGLALGSVASADSGDASGNVYAHTITVQEDNASMKAATIIAEEGAIQTQQFTNVVCDSLNFEVSDGYASITASLIGQFPTTGASLTESFTSETEFAYHQYTAKFGTSFSNAAGNSATPLKSFSLNIANNVQLDEAFLSGSNEITDGGLVAGRLQITGSYSLHFENATELDKYKNNTKNAMIVTFTGADIGTSDSEEITIKLADLVLTSPPVEHNIDGLSIITQEFEVSFDATDSEIEVTVVNLADGTDY